MNKLTFEEAYKIVGRDEAFRGTIYAMNTLLLSKGIYTPEEYEDLFIEHAITYQRKLGRGACGTSASKAEEKP